MKIAIGGAHSTGKTSFLDDLTEALRSAGYDPIRLGDLAVQARDIGFGILRDHTFESTMWIITQGMADEFKAGCHPDAVIVVDRPVTDALGYLNAALALRGQKLEPDQRESLESIVGHHMSSYDIVIESILDTSIPIEDDGRRDLDSDYRLLIAAEISRATAKFYADVIPLSPNGRTNLVDELVRRVAAHI